MTNSTPITPEIIRYKFLQGLGKDNEVFATLEKEQRWHQLKSYFNLVIHAYYLYELTEYFFESGSWKICTKNELEGNWLEAFELNDGKVLARLSSPWIWGMPGAHL